jgi:hypothetical protein
MTKPESDATHQWLTDGIHNPPNGYTVFVTNEGCYYRHKDGAWEKAPPPSWAVPIVRTAQP